MSRFAGVLLAACLLMACGQRVSPVAAPLAVAPEAAAPTPRTDESDAPAQQRRAGSPQSRVVTARAPVQPAVLTPEPASTVDRAPRPRREQAPVSQVSPRSEPPDQPAFDWEYPPLTMAIYSVNGALAVGPQTFGSNGCARFIAHSEGSVIEVDGVRHPADPNIACPGVVQRFWEDVPLAADVTEVTVRYRGKAGTYRFDRSAAGVSARHASGDHIAPLMATQSWEIPDDILAVHVYNGTAAAVSAIADRVHDRLLDQGARAFARPAGVPIVPAMHGAFSAGDLDHWWREQRVAGNPSTIRRVYRASLDEASLQRIADEETAREHCASLQMVRSHEWRSSPAVKATRACDRREDDL